MTKTKHTPQKFHRIDGVGPDCGCSSDGVYVHLCPLHKAAPKLLDAAKNALEALCEAQRKELITGLANEIDELEAAIAEAEEGEDE